MTQKNERPRLQNFFIILSLGILNALTPFSIDMYLPAFPQIAADFQVSVTQVALSVSLYFVGFALGQIFYGPLLDRFGRKKPLYAGLTIYLIATIGCLFSTTLTQFLFFRFLSALGGCAAGVGAVAMVRDFFPAEAAAKVFSMLMLVLSVSPLLAPGAGSIVVMHAGWRTIFGILAVFCVIDLALLAFVIPKGYEPDASVQLKLKPILNNFLEILRNRQFTIYTVTGSLSFAGLFVYIAGSPAIFMDSFKVSTEVYGYIFAFLAAGMIGGGQINLLLSRWFKNASIFRFALIAEVIFGIIFFIGTLSFGYGLYATVALLFLILLSTGIGSPNATALALAPFSKNVGSASALLGFLQLGIGAITSAGVGLLEVKGSLPTATVICLASLLGLVILMFTTRKPQATYE